VWNIKGQSIYNKTKNSLSELLVQYLFGQSTLPLLHSPGYKAAMTESKPLSLREKNRLRSRQELLDAVLDLFDQGGLAACSVEAVAKLVGASKTTVYSYFPGGIDEMLRDIYRLISQRVIALGTQMRDDESEPGARILAPARALFSLCTEPKVGRFYMMLSPALSPLLQPVVGVASGAFKEMFAEDLVALGYNRECAEIHAVVINGAIRECAVSIAEHPAKLPNLLAALTNVVMAIAEKRPGV
jgi:AcrR family transcriptional regulator